MDRLDRLELFARIVEGGSFARAARELRAARSSATQAVQELERETGVRLPEFLARHPKLSLTFSQGDRLADIVRKGVDCAIRAGRPQDSSLRMRRLGELPEITCASPDYLACHGTPRHVDDLEGRRAVGFVSSRSGDVPPVEFVVEGRVVTRDLPAAVATDNSDTAAAFARAGLGLIQAPCCRFAEDLARGALIEVLLETPPEAMPLKAMHAGDRFVSRRLEVFLDWAKDCFAGLS